MGTQHKSTKCNRYSSEFKREAVALVTKGGLTIAQVVRDLGLNDNVVIRLKRKMSKTASVLVPVKGIPKTKNCLGCTVKSRCCARNGRY